MTLTIKEYTRTIIKNPKYKTEQCKIKKEHDHIRCPFLHKDEVDLVNSFKQQELSYDLYMTRVLDNPLYKRDKCKYNMDCALHKNKLDCLFLHDNEEQLILSYRSRLHQESKLTKEMIINCKIPQRKTIWCKEMWNKNNKCKLHHKYKLCPYLHPNEDDKIKSYRRRVDDIINDIVQEADKNADTKWVDVVKKSQVESIKRIDRKGSVSSSWADDEGEEMDFNTPLQLDDVDVIKSDDTMSSKLDTNSLELKSIIKGMVEQEFQHQSTNIIEMIKDNNSNKYPLRYRFNVYVRNKDAINHIKDFPYIEACSYVTTYERVENDTIHAVSMVIREIEFDSFTKLLRELGLNFDYQKIYTNAY